MFCIQGLTSRGLTRKEDRGRLLPFEQSCRPGVKTQPESHSEHAGSCQLQDKKHVYCLWRRFNVLSVRLYSNTSVILHICPHLQINHRETHVKQKDTELATEPRKGLKSERNWASTLLSNRKGRPLVGIKKTQCRCKGSLTQTSFFIQAEAMSMSVVWTCRNASKAGIAARVTLFLMFGRTLCSQQGKLTEPAPPEHFFKLLLSYYPLLK